MNSKFALEFSLMGSRGVIVLAGSRVVMVYRIYELLVRSIFTEFTSLVTVFWCHFA